MGKVYKNDIGTGFRFNAGADLTDATVLTVCYKKSNGETGIWTNGEIWNGTWKDKYGKIDPKYDKKWFRHVTIDGDLNEADDATAWEFQIYVELPSGKWHGGIDVEIIYETLC